MAAVKKMTPIVSGRASIVTSADAVKVNVEFQVQRWGVMKKRRKNWRVVRVETRTPACLVVDGVMYMHPTLVEQLPKLKLKKYPWESL